MASCSHHNTCQSTCGSGNTWRCGTHQAVSAWVTGWIDADLIPHGITSVHFSLRAALWAIIVVTASNVEAEIKFCDVVYSMVGLSRNGIWYWAKFKVNQKSINS